MTALFLFARGRTVLLLHLAFAIGLAGSLLTALVYEGAARDLAVTWAAFFAVAACIGAIVVAGTAASEPVGAHALRADPADSVPGEDTPDAPPSIKSVHPEDRPAAARAAAYAFWTGVPQVLQCRQRQPDGSYRWAEFRAEPGYGVSVDVDAMLSGPDERWRASGTVGETFEAVRAAKVIESLYGKAWVFDAEGQFTYVTPAAQAAIDMTLRDLNAPVRGGKFVDGGDVGWSRGVHPDDYESAAASLRHCLKTGEHWHVEYRMLRATGAYVWHRIAARPTRDGQGRITGWYGTSIDIDVYKKIEAALRERERELSQLVDMVPSHLWRLTPDGEPTFFNKRMVDFLGLDVADTDRPETTRLEAMIGAGVHPDDTAAFRNTLSRSLATGESFAMRYRLRRADGVYRWMSSRAEPMRDQDGCIVQWYGLCHDIDDQMRAEAALHDRERELSQIVNMVPVHIRRLTPQGEPTFFNRRLIDFCGLDLTDLGEPDTGRLPTAIRTLVHPDDAAGLLQKVRDSVATGEPYSMKYRMRRADGAYRWVDGRAEPLHDESGAIVQWYTISIDIDDEVRTQQALRERERELSQLVDMVPSHLWRLPPGGAPIFFNKHMIDFLGLNAEDAGEADASRLSDIMEAVVHPEDAAGMREALDRSFVTGENFSLNYRLRRADGVYRWMSGRAEPMRDDRGRIVQWYGLAHDIDDLVTAQEALRERERALWQLVETLPAMIDCAAPDGEPIYRSQQLREFLGYNLELLDGTGKSRLTGTLDAGVHPDDLAGVKERYARSLSTGEPYARRHRLRRFDGEYRWVETRAAAMRNAEGAVVQWNVICLDIDGEVRTQEKLRLAQEGLARASQAASLAELSASIAHEVNQPLAAIVANSHACHRWLSAVPPNVDRAKITAERIVRDANSAADVVSRIRALFRQSVERRISATLDSVVAEARSLMAEDALRRRVRIDVDIEGDLPLVAFDRVQLQQVLVNLIRNGMDAMDTATDGKVLGMRVRRTGDAVQTEINDRGHGVEFPDRIFEPFFTTKEGGMGMGLAICRSIVESHGGRMWVEKNEPHGARFIFTLPIEAKPAS